MVSSMSAVVESMSPLLSKDIISRKGSPITSDIALSIAAPIFVLASAIELDVCRPIMNVLYIEASIMSRLGWNFRPLLVKYMNTNLAYDGPSLCPLGIDIFRVIVDCFSH